MKRLLYFLLLSSLLACKDKPNDSDITVEVTEVLVESKMSDYPLALDSIFSAHGGMTKWRSKKTLEFVFKNGEVTEKHSTDLKTRRDKIESTDYTLGFDGQEVWLLDPKDDYKGDEVFYHNLMFYFYAMPFVLGDPGIEYGEAEILTFQDKKYPGIRISYKPDIGTSPKDEYYLHYDPTTYQMKWLGYTVTYKSGEKSDNVKWIRYENWMNHGGLLLPEVISWYNYKGNIIKEKKREISFEDVRLSESARPNSFYAKPKGTNNTNSQNQ
ncbi:MAG: DUF6503 family protein [Eudoraea sp.]|uniref:DUF6503 family protein n=1 Tax=Eudoraea sp. TaxID=1979955 RepID=UPI003C78E208